MPTAAMCGSAVTALKSRSVIACYVRRQPHPTRSGHSPASRLQDQRRAMPELRRYAVDHRRHRRARSDRQHPHAPGLGRARTAALAGAAAGALPGGLILKINTVLQPVGRSGAACARVWRSECVETVRLGAISGSRRPRETEFFTGHHAIDRPKHWLYRAK